MLNRLQAQLRCACITFPAFWPCWSFCPSRQIPAETRRQNYSITRKGTRTKARAPRETGYHTLMMNLEYLFAPGGPWLLITKAWYLIYDINRSELPNHLSIIARTALINIFLISGGGSSTDHGSVFTTIKV
jgi:hypothetical protein